MRLSAFGLVAALALLSGEALAQEPDAPVAVPDVVVTARDVERIEGFVDALVTPGRQGRNRGQVARWHDPVCLRVIGAAYEDNLGLTGKINTAIRDLGVRTAGARCNPNVIVVVAHDADAFSGLFVSRYRNRFFGQERYERTSFVTPPRPVRWRHRIRTGAVRPAAGVISDIGPGAAASAGLPNTRLKTSTTQQIDRAMIVVDPDRLEGVHSDSLSDYLAMAIVVDLPVSPAIEGRPSILTLFGDRSADRLTDWDRAFVAALYAQPADELFPFQRAGIAQRMRSYDATRPSPLD